MNQKIFGTLILFGAVLEVGQRGSDLISGGTGYSWCKVL